MVSSPVFKHKHTRIQRTSALRLAPVPPPPPPAAAAPAAPAASPYADCMNAATAPACVRWFSKSGSVRSFSAAHASSTGCRPWPSSSAKLCGGGVGVSWQRAAGRRGCWGKVAWRVGSAVQESQAAPLLPALHAPHASLAPTKHCPHTTAPHTPHNPFTSPRPSRSGAPATGCRRRRRPRARRGAARARVQRPRRPAPASRTGARRRPCRRRAPGPSLESAARRATAAAARGGRAA